jgi:hypothetical protein
MSLPELPPRNVPSRRESHGNPGSATTPRVLSALLVMLLCWASKPLCLFANDSRWQWQSPVTHEIRYHLSEPDKVLLVWWPGSREAVP